MLEAILPGLVEAWETPSGAELVAVYKALAERTVELDSVTKELEEADAATQRRETEHDAALNDRDASVRDQQQQIDALVAEVAQLKLERDTLRTSQASLQNQLHALSSSQTTSSGELDSLRSRVEDAESEKRSLMGVVERLKEQDAGRDDEVRTLRDRLKDARDEISTLQQGLASASSKATSSEFKASTLEQELLIANQEREQLRVDVSTQIEERSKYRRDKDAHARTLQQQLDEVSAAASRAQTQLTALQAAHDTQQRQLSQALTKAGDLQGELAVKEAAFKVELANTKRMVDMLERRHEDTRAHVSEVDREWVNESAKNAAKEEVLRRDAERERMRADELEKELDSLRALVDHHAQAQPTSETTNGHGHGFTLSPTATLAAKLQKTGRTYTEVYADFIRLQDELGRQRSENARLEECMAQILGDIEERAPLLQEQRVEYERVSAEARSLSARLADALEERSTAVKRATRLDTRTRDLEREKALLETQLSDLGRQVQTLLRQQLLSQTPGLAQALSADETGAAVQVDDLIARELVLFKSVEELQQQNARLLGITRDLGQRMEQAEQETQRAADEADSAMLREAEALVEAAQAELEDARRTSRVRIEALQREADMLKSLLGRAQGGSGAASQVGAGGVGGEYQSMYTESQRAFDAFKLEIGADNRHLKEDLASAQREVTQITTQLAKANAKITTLEESLRLANDEKAASQRALSEVSAARATLTGTLARLETLHADTSEKHTVASSLLVQAQNQIVQLRADHAVVKGAHDRLVAENAGLRGQATHLADVMGNLRKMQADLEKAEEGDKRRLEARVVGLEGTVEEVRGQLARERDVARAAQFQRENEARAMREKMDKATADLGVTREHLVAAQTSQTHLQARVDDLSKQLSAAQERLAVYDRRPAASASASAAAGLTSADAGQLETEVADLRAALKIAEVDLVRARADVETFQGISKSSEELLAQVNETYERYRADTEKEAAEKNAALASLEQRVVVLQEELAGASARVSELQTTLGSERAAFAADKRELEELVADMQVSSSETERAAHAQAVATQEARARAAEANYQRELVAHADTVRSFERVKEQLGQVQAGVREFQTRAETAEARLGAAEQSWAAQREVLDKQIGELGDKHKELVDQNNKLHSHLENVTSQAARIRSAAESSVGSGADAAADSSDLQGVVSFLRKEKEIADLQLEINKQEIARHKADIERLSKELDEQTALLAEERARMTTSLASAEQQKELVERIEQLNLLRESNATLRAELTTHRKRVAQLEAQVQAAQAELEPARADARAARAEAESKAAQIARLQLQATRWQERNESLMKKYDRPDPEEVQQLKTQLVEKESEKEAIDVQRKAAEEKADVFKNNLTRYKEQYEKLVNTSRTNLGQLKNEIGQLKTQVESLTAEREELQKKLAESSAASANSGVSAASSDEQLQTRLAAVEAEKAQLEAEKKSLTEQLAAASAAGNVAPVSDIELTALRAERDALVAEKATWAETNADAARLVELETVNKDLEAKVTKLTDDGKRFLGQNGQQKTQLQALAQQRAALMKELQELKAKQPAAAESSDIAGLKLQITELEKRLAEQPPLPADQAAAVKTAVDAAQEAFKVEQSAAVKQAMEAGRNEVAAKLKLKDTQLTSFRAKVAAYEEVLKQNNITPPKVAPPPAAPAKALPTPAVASTSAVPAPATSAAATALPAPAATAARKPSLALPGGLPSKPVIVGDAVPATTVPGPAGRGAHSGVVRGAPRARGAIPRGRGGAAGRGGGPAAAVAAAASAAAQDAEGSAGAAGHKRSREPEATGDASQETLTKRLKPGPPVQIVRNRDIGS
ncbi:hypothetical protein BKA62DRAFT_833732 [Auriculariales sp. MPI-PUGE-AT-0066]|nr:hypothetical protein BKA62DRAFT_833732 [Auriculariales sp. MPI-PUGE-AT-0066]